MVRSTKRLRLCAALLAMNIAFIWGNSLLPGEISGGISNGLKAFLEMFFGQGEGSGGDGGLLRKLAHFTEFACLGVLLRWLFGMLTEKKWQGLCFPVAAGVAVASVDETIQIFVPDRGPHIKDVGIDALGLVLGILIISLTTHIKNEKLKENA